jgi:hypothetical protein
MDNLEGGEWMKQYIVTLNRNLGIGNDIVNFFKNRGLTVVWEDREIFQKTVIVEGEMRLEDISQLKYVSNAKVVRHGSVNI